MGNFLFQRRENTVQAILCLKEGRILYKQFFVWKKGVHWIGNSLFERMAKILDKEFFISKQERILHEEFFVWKKRVYWMRNFRVDEILYLLWGLWCLCLCKTVLGLICLWGRWRWSWQKSKNRLEQGRWRRLLWRWGFRCTWRIAVHYKARGLFFRSLCNNFPVRLCARWM